MGLEKSARRLPNDNVVVAERDLLGAGNAVGEGASTVGHAADNTLSGVGNAVADVGEGVKDPTELLPNVGGALGHIVGGVGHAVGDSLSGIGDVVSNVGKGVGEVVSNVVSSVSHVASVVIPSPQPTSDTIETSKTSSQTTSKAGLPGIGVPTAPSKPPPGPALPPIPAPPPPTTTASMPHIKPTTGRSGPPTTKAGPSTTPLGGLPGIGAPKHHEPGSPKAPAGTQIAPPPPAQGSSIGIEPHRPPPEASPAVTTRVHTSSRGSGSAKPTAIPNDSSPKYPTHETAPSTTKKMPNLAETPLSSIHRTSSDSTSKVQTGTAQPHSSTIRGSESVHPTSSASASPGIDDSTPFYPSSATSNLDTLTPTESTFATSVVESFASTPTNNIRVIIFTDPSGSTMTLNSAQASSMQSVLASQESILASGGLVTTTNAVGHTLTLSGAGAASSLVGSLTSQLGPGFGGGGGGAGASAPTGDPASMSSNGNNSNGKMIGIGVGVLLVSAFVAGLLVRKRRQKKAAVAAKDRDSNFFSDPVPAFTGFPVTFDPASNSSPHTKSRFSEILHDSRTAAELNKSLRASNQASLSGFSFTPRSTYASPRSAKSLFHDDVSPFTSPTKAGIVPGSFSKSSPIPDLLARNAESEKVPEKLQFRGLYTASPPQLGKEADTISIDSDPFRCSSVVIQTSPVVDTATTVYSDSDSFCTARDSTYSATENPATSTYESLMDDNDDARTVSHDSPIDQTFGLGGLEESLRVTTTGNAERTVTPEDPFDDLYRQLYASKTPDIRSTVSSAGERLSTNSDATMMAANRSSLLSTASSSLQLDHFPHP